MTVAHHHVLKKLGILVLHGHQIVNQIVGMEIWILVKLVTMGMHKRQMAAHQVVN